MKRLVMIALTICLTLLGIVLLWVFGPVWQLFGGSLALSAALRPLVQRLEGRGMGRGMAILVWYLLILGGLGLGLFLYGLQLAQEVATAVERLPRFYEATREAWHHGEPIQQMISRGLPDFDTLIQGGATGGGLIILGGTVANLAGYIADGLVFIVALLSLSYYWLLEVGHFERLWLSLLPVGTRIRAREIWRNAEVAVGAYIRSTFGAITIAALLLLALYSVLGLPFAVLFSLLGGLGHLVPPLGLLIALLPPFLVALTISPLEAVLVLIGSCVIQLLTHRFAVRRMQLDALKVNPLLQVLLVLALADLGGWSAMIFAPPLAAFIQVLYRNLLPAANEQPRESAIELLADRLAELRVLADPARKEQISMLERSDELLKQAAGLLDTNASNS